MNPALVLGSIIHSAHGEYTTWLEPWNSFIQILNPMLRGNSFFVTQIELGKAGKAKYLLKKEFCIRKLKQDWFKLQLINLARNRQLLTYET